MHMSLFFVGMWRKPHVSPRLGRLFRSGEAQVARKPSATALGAAVSTGRSAAGGGGAVGFQRLRRAIGTGGLAFSGSPPFVVCFNPRNYVCRYSMLLCRYIPHFSFLRFAFFISISGWGWWVILGLQSDQCSLYRGGSRSERVDFLHKFIR